MKTVIRTPFLEIGVKNYIFGEKVMELARAADESAKRYDIDILFIAPYADIRRIAENTTRLIVLAPYMDTLRPGRGMGAVLPESVKAAGAMGVVINHCEKPASLKGIRETIERARELDMISFVCADTIEEAKAAAQFHPDIINPEPAERIGTGEFHDMDYVRQSVREIRQICPHILVEQAGGITSGTQVYDCILAGSHGAGAASGIVMADNPLATVDEMAAGVRRAKDYMEGKEKQYESLL